MAFGILFLRLVLGLTITAHGAQKLFGAFGGDGPAGTADQFRRLGFRAPVAMALAAGAAEMVGGLLLAAGLLTPVAALAIAVVMVNAIAAVHVDRGFWNTGGGYEYNLVLWAAAVALAATGGGRYSFDALLGVSGELRGAQIGALVLLGSLVVSAVVSALGRPGRGSGNEGVPPHRRTARRIFGSSDRPAETTSPSTRRRIPHAGAVRDRART